MSPSTHGTTDAVLADQTISISGDPGDDHQNIKMSSILEDSHPRVGDSRPPPPGAWGVQGAGEVGNFPENEVTLTSISL